MTKLIVVSCKHNPSLTDEMSPIRAARHINPNNREIKGMECSTDAYIRGNQVTLYDIRGIDTYS
jgi:hypothetical protein